MGQVKYQPCHSDLLHDGATGRNPLRNEEQTEVADLQRLLRVWSREGVQASKMPRRMPMSHRVSFIEGAAANARLVSFVGYRTKVKRLVGGSPILAPTPEPDASCGQIHTTSMIRGCRPIARCVAGLRGQALLTLTGTRSVAAERSQELSLWVTQRTIATRCC